jgi:ABC-type multidrug transport system ATPase subunit
MFLDEPTTGLDAFMSEQVKPVLPDCVKSDLM